MSNSISKKSNFNYNAGNLESLPEKGTVATTTPLIFTKKIKDNYKIIPQNTIVNTLGQTKHFPAATKEWFNSIYAYNNNSIKNLPVLDKTLARILKSYFNLSLKDSVLKSLEQIKAENKSKRTSKRHSKRLPTRFKRLSLNRIFLSKAELKHTSSKVIITLFVYNAEKRSLNDKLRSIVSRIFPSLEILKRLKKGKDHNQEPYNSPLSIGSRFSKVFKLCGIILNILYKTKPKNTKYNVKKWYYSYMLESGLIDTASRKNLAVELNQNKAFADTIINPDIFKAGIFKAAAMIYLNKELKAFSETKMELAVNKSKFEDSFLSKLTPLISRLYNKEVEFNIVNLKALYLNSDIFLQAISTKLKNRDNRLLRVLRSALSLVKLPKVNRMREKYGKDDRGRIWVNNVKNLSLNSYDCMDFVPASGNLEKDYLSQLLLDITPMEYQTLNGDVSEIQNVALSNIKHRVMAGVRLEAKGRLTRRFTASRSVFKVKWKGGLRNIESSYRGLSTVMLRGHAKSNAQYSLINSKTRVGAFGIKGWIAGK